MATLDLSEYGLGGDESEFLRETVSRHGVLLGKLIHQAGSGNILYGIDDPTISADISTHAALGSAHHVKYSDANAIAAVEGEATLDLTGLVDFSQVATGILPTDAAHLATKEYVDSAVTFIGEYHFNNTASSYGGIFFKMLDTHTGEAEASFVSGSLGEADDQALVNFATDPGVPGLTCLGAGIYTGHIYAKVDASNKRPVKLHFEIYTKLEDSPFTETLIATSEESDFLTDTQTHYDIHAVLAADADLASTDRIVVKWLANVGSPPNNDVVVTLYVEGSNHSRLSVPISSEVLSQVYLRQDGTKVGSVSQAQDFGSNGIKADAVAESTGSAGVTVDDVLIKDQTIEVTTITPDSGTAGNDLLLKTNIANDSFISMTSYFNSNPTVTFTTSGGVPQLQARAGQKVAFLSATSHTGTAFFIDYAALTLGSGNDATISYNTADLTINPQAVGSGNLKLLAGRFVIPNGGYIGSVGDTDAIQIEADGDVVLSQDLAVVAGSISVSSPGLNALLLSGSAAIRSVISQATTDAVGPYLMFEKRRGTLGSSALVESGDVLGDIRFYGYYNSGNEGQGAAITSVATENFDVAGFGSEIQFHTVDNNSTTLDERWVIENDGTLQATGAMALNTSGAAALGSVTLTTDLAVTHGGTGVSALTDHGVMLGSGTGGVTVVSPVAGPSATAGFQYLRSPDASSDAVYKEVMQSFTFTIEDPADVDSIAIHFFFQAVTIREIQTAVVGTSAVWNMYHSTNRGTAVAGGDKLFQNDQTSNSTDTLNHATFGTGDQTVVADSWLVIDFGAITACTELNIIVRYTID